MATTLTRRSAAPTPHGACVTPLRAPTCNRTAREAAVSAEVETGRGSSATTAAVHVPPAGKQDTPAPPHGAQPPTCALASSRSPVSLPRASEAQALTCRTQPVPPRPETQRLPPAASTLTAPPPCRQPAHSNRCAADSVTERHQRIPSQRTLPHSTTSIHAGRTRW